MATAARKSEPAENAGNQTNPVVNKNVHGFSGETVEIRLFKAEPGEPTQPFFGINTYSCQLQREKWVVVPRELADHIESLLYTVKEYDPEHPDDESKVVWAQKQRFPIQRR